MSLIGIGANCGKHTYPSPRRIVVLFSPFPRRASARSTNRRERARTAGTVLRVGTRVTRASTRVLVHICIWIFLRYVYISTPFPLPAHLLPVAPRTENNARDPTPINWFLRDICNFLAARLSPRSFIAHFICARPPLSRRSAEARNHGWSYVTFTSELAKLIRPFFKRTNNAASVWYTIE